jgi:uncharacterized protein YdaU (DUF1376 family)
MSKREQLPYMPFFVGDYLKETRRLTTEEHGAYVLLILEYWAKGGNLPDDDAQLARIAGLKLPTWRKMRPVIQAFFHDGWRHEGLDKQLVYAADRKQRARKAALARYSETADSELKTTDAPSMPRASEVPCPEHAPSISRACFEQCLSDATRV